MYLPMTQFSEITESTATTKSNGTASYNSGVATKTLTSTVQNPA